MAFLKKTVSFILMIGIVFSLSACGEKTETPNAGSNDISGEIKEKTNGTDEKDGEQIADENSGRIDTLIIGTTTQITEGNRSEYNFDVLSGTLCQLAPVCLDESGDYLPLLCDFSTEDNITWKLTVKDGFTWHDGEKVTSGDIKFTLEYLDAQTGGGYADRYEKIEVASEDTVVLTLLKANLREPSNWTTLRIMPEHIYAGVEDYTTVPNESANIGCGPYCFAGFDDDSGTILFTAYDDYSFGKPCADYVVFKLFDSEDTMYLSLISGELDMVYKYSGGVSAKVIGQLSGCDDLQKINVKNTANPACFIFNNNAEPFDNENIRKAVAYAIDYSQFVNMFASEAADEHSSNSGFIPKGTLGYADTDKLERNLEKAKELLALENVSDTDGNGIVEYNGKDLIIPVMVRGDKQDHARYAEILKANLEDIGIKVEIDIEEVAVFREKTEQLRDYTSVLTGLTAFGMAKNQGMAALYMDGDSSMGYGQVYSEEYKELLQEIDNASTIEEYKNACAQVQYFYSETIPGVALFWDDYINFANKELKGFYIDGTFGILNAQTFISLKK